jgi:anti-anti-sigma regulatory factor
MQEHGHNRIRGSVAVDFDDNLCTITADNQPGLDIFHIAGIIDARAQSLLDNLHCQVESLRARIDFAGVKRINSMGVALLLRSFKRIRDEKHAEIRLSNLNEVNTMLFRITGVFLLATPEDDQPRAYLH